MSGVRRFLSRRDKSPAHRSPSAHDHNHHHHHHHSSSSSSKHADTKTERSPDHFAGLFTLPKHDPTKKPDKDEEKKVKAILERLRHYGIDKIVEANVEYALHAKSSQGDPEAAFRMLMMLEDTYEGIIKPYDSNVKLLGAVNREATTCYLDALLFAMFAKLDSFEAMLYENFADGKRKRLAGLLRLWVNMLRTGRLITVDVTEHIQNALADCGWTDAGRIRQQDPSEAFTFITAQLELPMLTLKMDMYHTGKEDPQDDHKFVNERLLEVAILDEPAEGQDVITLEDCLEHYFNNRIEVKRHMQNQRRNTLKSANLVENSIKVEKDVGIHVEVAEVPETPIAQSPAILAPMMERGEMAGLPSKVDQLRPTSGRKRADSIFSQRKVELADTEPNDLKRIATDGTTDSTGRKLSTRTEVLMPAWQFFKLLPWYTDHMPTSDAQVAAHFSKKRPVLGICLKRYSYTNTGLARRRDTYVDIPLEIAVPNFVSDDTMQDDGPLVGNFRLALQSVVCHRGVSVHSGHYVCLARGLHGNAVRREGSIDGQSDDGGMSDPWMRFDDLALERITPVDIHEALRKETPYLLFYQVLPIDDDGNSIHDLPSYTEATSRSQSDAMPLEKTLSTQPDLSSNHVENAISGAPPTSSSALDIVTPSHGRASLDIPAPRGRTGAPPSSIDETSEPRRKSIAFDTSSVSGGSVAATNSVPSTPSEEKDRGNSFLAVAGKFGGPRRASRQSKSRPTSTGPDGGAGRFGLNMSRLSLKMSNPNNTSNGKADGEKNTADEDVPTIQPSAHVATELAIERDAAAAPAYDDSEAAQQRAVTTPIPAASVNASRESVTAAPALGPGNPTGVRSHSAAPAVKGKKEKEKEREWGKVGGRQGRKGAKGEERDCVVM